ncbi:MAG TPA: hypothetical protein VF529_02715 [Solirubrobacteraceae bacterium]|jgi:hypothetical protein
MRELEDRLRALSVEWPATPDLAGAVVARIEETAAAGERRGSAARRGFAAPRRFGAPRGLARRRRLALALTLALLLPAGAAVAFPSARDDVLEWLGVKGVVVKRAAEPPPVVAPAPDELGRRVSTVEEAARLAGFRPVLPPSLGAPREIRFDPGTLVVTAVYGDVLVAEARGALTRELVEKIVGTTTGVEAVGVGGERGVYIDGPHAYLYERPGGRIGEDRPRRAERALVFNRGDVLVRIEGPSRQRALELARELR